MPNTPYQYAAAIYELSINKTEEQQNDLIKSLIKNLKENNILFSLPQIIKDIENIKKKESYKNKIRVSTTDKLTDEQKNDIRKQFGDGKYIFEENEKSIAGLIIQKNDILFYSTLSKATMQLENKLIA